MTTADTEHLLERVAAGDSAARDQLLQRHRRRLGRMVAVRFDIRLVARVDPSDVVQETLAEAAANLDRYVRERPLPFYPWLRQLAQRRVIDLHRGDGQGRRRGVSRGGGATGPPDHSAPAPAGRVLCRAPRPSAGPRPQGGRG